MIGRFNAALERDLGELPKTLMYEFETVAELAAYLCDSTAPALNRVLARREHADRCARGRRTGGFDDASRCHGQRAGFGIRRRIGIC